MEKSELISIMKEPACSVMKEKKVLPSIIIAESIRILYSDEMVTCCDKLIKANNPMAVAVEGDFNVEKIWNAKNHTLYRVYNSIEEGIENYITINENKFELIKEIYNYEDALSKLSGHFYKISELKRYISAYQLWNIDQIALKQIYSGNKNIVEINNDTSSAEMLKNFVKTHDGTGLINSKTKVEKEEYIKIKKPSKEELKKGSEIKLHRANLYTDNTTGKPIRCITGTYYLYNGVCKYNRYAIVMKKEYVGKWEFIIGYVNKDQIESVAL